MSKDIQPSSLGLRKIDLLVGLPAQGLDAIGRQCAWRHYEAGQRLVAREADDRDLHMIVAGSVRVTTYSSAGREISFRDLAEGTSYGELSALDGRPRSADVVALAPTLIASLPPASFLALLRDEWSVNEKVLLRLADLVRRLTDRVLDLSTLSVQRRIYDELLRLARAAGVARNRARLDPAPKHAEMASLVSTYREQVTRELSALVKAGVLAKDGAALVVIDYERLQRLAAQASTH
ncbi:MAG: transcriptional regulator, Crp/Fnr family [Ramlibacter sp.]|jgi:CRP/FNR family cyclic AMP-dependent transcriptional regulator|nr:transcriptional regulator, Crp/Fnr family [Ramlibacter sp.]